MRLLSRKIYRAFPELDKYEDDVCKRYVTYAIDRKDESQDWFFVISSMVVAIAFWLIIGTVLATLVNNLFRNIIGQFPYDEFVSDFIVLLLASGIIWFPAFIYLMIRDRWLHRCIRKQLVGVQCPPCGYSLIGLSIDSTDNPSVHCPECGQVTLLSDLGLTEADIDPTRIGEAS